jgi:hypothetical protein
MPTTWNTRGIATEEDTAGGLIPMHFTIRCDPYKDRTNGFYVARFDRVAPEPPASAVAKVVTVDDDVTSDTPAASSSEALKTDVEVAPPALSAEQEAALQKLRKAPPKIMTFSDDDSD